MSPAGIIVTGIFVDGKKERNPAFGAPKTPVSHLSEAGYANREPPQKTRAARGSGDVLPDMRYPLWQKRRSLAAQIARR
jgi:hypothetical protein